MKQGINGRNKEIIGSGEVSVRLQVIFSTAYVPPAHPGANLAPGALCEVRGLDDKKMDSSATDNQTELC
jgi:hypothetical protein